MKWDGANVYSGTARWTTDDKFILTVRTEDGDAVLGPYRPSFSDVVWYRFGVPRCGAETLWYWTDSE